MAALLHDVIEDFAIPCRFGQTFWGYRGRFGRRRVSKLDKIKFSNKEEAQVENFRKMVLAMVEDIRVILKKSNLLTALTTCAP